MDTRLRLLRSPRRGRGNREATERALAALAFREGRRVCELAAGGRWIRTISSPPRLTHRLSMVCGLPRSQRRERAKTATRSRVALAALLERWYRALVLLPGFT